MEKQLIEDVNLNFKDLFRIFQKRRKLIIVTFLIEVLALSTISFLLPKTYEAETTLRIKQPRSLDVSLLGSLPNGNNLNTKLQMATYAEIIRSRTVIDQVLEKTKAELAKNYSSQDLVQMITLWPIRDTELLKIKVQAGSANEAETIARVLVETFVKRITELTRTEQSNVRKFIGERLEESKLELAKAEQELEEYRRNHRVIAPSEETQAIIEQLSTMEKILNDNQIKIVSYNATLEAAQEQLANQKPELIAENTIIEQLKSKLTLQEIELVQLLEKYTEKHPDVLALQAAIAETRERLNGEINRVVNSEASSLNPFYQNIIRTKIQTEVELAATLAQQTAIRQLISKKEAELRSLPSKEQGLARVMREASIAQEINVMLAKRYEESRISEVMQPNDIQVVDQPRASDQPVKPNIKLNLLIAVFLGLVSSITLAFTLDYFNKTINDANDVVDYLNLPVLGVIPDFSLIIREGRGAEDGSKK
ncbi:MAG TPA: GNVR domain-containing protein [Bacillota bacterium]|nr:GNVR domain-containing protein [Bacillota bacterium]HOL08772.1 GNVR domain-containing protein [Bacillota bacterium]HPO96325.1 GNVR domain-containing protein [Bacillota bacterium]